MKKKNALTNVIIFLVGLWVLGHLKGLAVMALFIWFVWWCCKKYKEWENER